MCKLCAHCASPWRGLQVKLKMTITVASWVCHDNLLHMCQVKLCLFTHFVLELAALTLLYMHKAKDETRACFVVVDVVYCLLQSLLLLLPPLRQTDSDGATESTRPQILHIHPRHLLRLHFFSQQVCVCARSHCRGCAKWQSCYRFSQSKKNLLSVKPMKHFLHSEFGETGSKNSASGGTAWELPPALWWCYWLLVKKYIVKFIVSSLQLMYFTPFNGNTRTPQLYSVTRNCKTVQQMFWIYASLREIISELLNTDLL